MKQENFTPSAQLEQVLKSYKADYSADNKLTTEESETLMRLLKKALAPSAAQIAAETEAEATEAEALANISDKQMFEGGAGAEIAEAFSTISMELGFMLGEYMIKRGVDTPSEEIMTDFIKENNLPPLFFSKGTVISHFHSLFLKDPLTLLYNYKVILHNTPEAANKSIMVSAAAYVARKGMMA